LLQTLFTTKVMLCCALVSLFESSMFIFVFSWTPALSPNSDHALLPAGFIFAVYMMTCMSGASIYRLCNRLQTTKIMLGIFCLASAAMAVPAFGGISEEAKYINFGAFVIFELCVGAYFPAAASMKNEFVGDRHRVTVYNVFRTPMNIIVVVVLLTGPSLLSSFQLLCMQLALGTVILALFCICRNGTSDKQLPLLSS